MNWFQKLARSQYDFLGDELLVFRAVDLHRAEEVLNKGFEKDQFFTTSENRAVFYANFSTEKYPGAIFECVIDTSRSHADMNDANSLQQQESYEGIRQASSEIYNQLIGAGINDIDIYEIEHFIGSQAARDIGGYYDNISEASLWLFIANRTGISPKDISQLIPPGKYGGFFTLDNRGVFGIDSNIPSEQIQHNYFVPPQNIRAVYLHTSLLSDLGWQWDSYPSGVPINGIGDYVSIIPSQMEELCEEAEKQLAEAEDMSNFELSDHLNDLVNEFKDNMSSYEDEHGSIIMSGNVYRKLRTNQPLQEEDFDQAGGFIRFVLPSDRMKVLYAIRKGVANQ